MAGLNKLPKVTALGGGHGLSATLSALRRVTDQITAVVTVADDGGSSGRLREELGCLPPGDLRMALAALCSDDYLGRTWAEVLQSRFSSDGVLDGHAIGNLLIAGVWEMIDPVTGLELVGKLLQARGRVLPMSLQPLEIEADVIGVNPNNPDHMCVLRGQAAVAKTKAEVVAIRLVPNDPPACPQALEAIADSDYVMLGPGSWFTSVLPHLLVPDLAEAIITSRAKRVVNLNLVPAAETDGFSPSKHIELLAEHAPRIRLDTVIADRSFADQDPHLEKFVEMLGGRLVVTDIAMRDGSARHDPLKFGAVFRDLFVN